MLAIKKFIRLKLDGETADLQKYVQNKITYADALKLHLVQIHMG